MSPAAFRTFGWAITAAAAVVVASALAAQTRRSAPTVPAAASVPGAEPADDLEYWLRQASRPASQSASGAAIDAPFAAKPDANGPPREDALPGVIELSDGKQLPGWLFTTQDKPWGVYVETEQRWRNIPFIAVLSISAVVVEEKMEPEWRWKEMGVPERVYTGREYPYRRFLWKFRLIDGTEITGAVKGQPVWAQLGETRAGPMVLHERSKGEPGQKFADLAYVQRILVSRRAMDEVLRASPPPSSRPAG